ncbi:MAG: hypothetical protein ACKPKO_24120, partial [Candidatus Fonsibacter sp.]
NSMGYGIVLANTYHADQALITRSKDKFDSDRYATYVGRWGLFMVSNDLFLVSPGTDATEANQYGTVSIGGWTKTAVPEPNLTVNSKTRMVGIGTTTPTSKLQVVGKNHRCQLPDKHYICNRRNTVHKGQSQQHNGLCAEQRLVCNQVLVCRWYSKFRRMISD